MKKKINLLLSIVLSLSCLFGLSACNRQEEVVITTTIYPVEYIIHELTDKVTVYNLSNDEIIERASMKSDYKSILDQTSLFVYIDELEPYLELHEKDIQGYDFDIINLTTLSAIDNFARYTVNTVNGINVVRESAYYEGSEFELVDTYRKDPFLWINPITMVSMAFTIKEWLQSRFPQDALILENNFKDLQASLVRMDVEYQALKSLDVKFVSVLPVFGNWQKSYHVQVYPLCLSRFGVLPNEQQLAVIEKSIRDNEVKYIAYDSSLPEDMQALYERVKEDLDLETIDLSGLLRLSAADIENNKDYLTIMYNNLIAIEDVFK